MMIQYAEKKSRPKVYEFFILFSSLTAFLNVTVFSSLINLVLSSFFVFLIFFYNKIYIEKKLVFFFLFFLAPSFVSIFSIFPAIVLYPQGIDYGNIEIFGRVFNIFVFLSFILLSHSFLFESKKIIIFKWYWVGALVLIFFALWHAISIYMPFVSFPFETRSHLHSAGSVEVDVGINRVTGIAREPSYLVPFLVDFIIITFLVVGGFFKRFLFIVISVIILILSLSPSGYLILFGSLFFSILFFLFRKTSLKIVFFNFFILFFITIFVVFYLEDNSYLSYIYERFKNADPDSSGRIYMNVMPFYWIAESSWFQFLFGNGIKSFSVIGTKFFLFDGEPVHVTSNNFFVDMLWESGVVGFVLLISFFVYMFFSLWRFKCSSFQFFLGLMIFFDLFFSSLVRADYASFRYFLMLYLFFVFVNYDLSFYLKNEKN
jgi:hypothetical protein